MNLIYEDDLAQMEGALFSLNVWQGMEQKTVAIIIDHGDGVSVTSRLEQITAELLTWFKAEPAELEIVYRDRMREWSQVTFQTFDPVGGPTWSTVDVAWFESRDIPVPEDLSQ